MLESFFIYDTTLPAALEKGAYSPILVAASYVVAFFGSYTGLMLAVRLFNSSTVQKRRVLHWAGAFALGSGIWSMHFIGMLAYKMRMEVHYDPLLTALSMIVAISVAWFVLQITQAQELTPKRLTASAVLLGLGISAMHYTGMAAMEMDASLRYVPSLFLLSVAIAIAASGAALWIIFTLGRHSGRWQIGWRMLAALVMAAAICGMHYTGMAASVLQPYADCRFDANQSFVMLAITVIAITGVISLIALVLGVSNRLFALVVCGAIFALPLVTIVYQSISVMNSAVRFTQVEYALKKTIILYSSVTALFGFTILFGFLYRTLARTERAERQAASANRAKSEFLSTVSHELRTPLTSIRGALGLMAGGAAGALPVKVMELVNIAHKNSERLVRIVNDILDIEKIKSGKLQLLLRPVDLSALVRQAIEANQPYAEKHRVRLVLEHASDQALLMADPDRLMQVMANLLSNAAKFSKEDSQVLVRVDRLAGRLRISVQDHGAGIPEAFRSHVFEKFAQADASASRGHEGTGLGLSITRRLTEAMGGTVGFTTETGKGSIFYVDLPALAKEEGIVPIGTAGTELAKSRVLVVEDNKDNATLIKILLEQSGLDVDIAYTLAEARGKLGAQSYVAMTLDLTLPDGDGITLLREVRSRPATQNLPVVVVSGKAEESKNALGGWAVGLVDWLVKPIDELQLVRALRHAISHDHEGLPRILHVEDDPDISLILRAMLKDQAEIVTAATLHEARALLGSRNFALIVLDLSLPDGSGMELLKYMNTLAVKSTPVLILSASEASADIRARVAGALVKSRTSDNTIVETILSLVRQASAAGRGEAEERVNRSSQEIL